jgi:hypothetical protein
MKSSNPDRGMSDWGRTFGKRGLCQSEASAQYADHRPGVGNWTIDYFHAIGQRSRSDNRSGSYLVQKGPVKICCQLRGPVSIKRSFDRRWAQLQYLQSREQRAGHIVMMDRRGNKELPKRSITTNSLFAARGNPDFSAIEEALAWVKMTDCAQ